MGGPDLRRSRQSAQTARNALNAAFREAVLAAGLAPPGDLVLSTGRGRRNPEWKLGGAVRVVCDAQELLTLHTPEEILRLYGGPFLPGSEHAWVEAERETLRRHMTRVLQEGAARVMEHDPDAALAWLVRAAELAQTPQAFEQVLNLAQSRGHAALRWAASRALGELARGEVATLGEAARPN